MDQHTLDRIRSNDHRALSRVITQIESGQPISDTFFKEVHTLSHDALRIGITGPPGAGKSTLTDQLIQILINDGKSVGVVAVDPTSPFTGGALLGDRVRMNHYLFNDNVFIRSMGSHGDLGGLARKAQDVGDLLAASGKDVIIFETVGVGQGEHDVAKAVDMTVVVLVPESGDEIQLMKAGLIEISDIFVVNKSDRDGAGRLAQSLKAILHTFTQKGKLEPPVFNTSADRKEGVADLYQGIIDHLTLMKDEGVLKAKQLERYRNRIFNLIQDRLLRKFWTQEKLDQMELSIQNLELTNTSPHEVANSLLEGSHD
ncbi:MAG: methylmalonyl Co-A mutase-associated GTPase MeaB [Candidatus Marinimicrobia bacterium]|nr:methylmalonyl Co-A mutase-associated GTPase MeaB [Candidatus Neomarinimicrobiota bacterium]MDD9887326.1 methylmalonyl Co-A mutase-associated GTPase MeaB [Candidatus Neomarinimicrobiota bacterium]MDD9930739.1 methylmalonyl Co-A mutase-associated GTPase MeaB [Candidatus Neomarinimicrobiota bacterium]